MFSDQRARAAWRLFRARAEWMLGSVSGAARKDILSDLDAHVRDAVADAEGGDEHMRLTAVLERLGDPREFLEPLLADAVFKRPRPVNDAMLPVQTVLIAVHSGAKQLAIAVGNLALAATGAALALLGVMRFLLPSGAGVFRLSADDFQIRLLGFGQPEGVQVLPAWVAGALFLVGIALVAWSLRNARRQLATFLVQSER